MQCSLTATTSPVVHLKVGTALILLVLGGCLFAALVRRLDLFLPVDCRVSIWVAAGSGLGQAKRGGNGGIVVPDEKEKGRRNAGTELTARLAVGIRMRLAHNAAVLGVLEVGGELDRLARSGVKTGMSVVYSTLEEIGRKGRAYPIMASLSAPSAHDPGPCPSA